MKLATSIFAAALLVWKGAPVEANRQGKLRGSRGPPRVEPRRQMKGAKGARNPEPTIEEPVVVEQQNSVRTFVGTVKVRNLAPESGTCQTPVWVGIHNGDFNIYDRGVAASSALEAIAEDGDPAPLIADFAVTDGAVWDDVVFGPDMPPVLCPGQTGEVQFMFDATSGVPLYFSYATMVLPSNDAFLANGNPKAFLVVTGDNEPMNVTFVDSGSDVLDAGTEVNDEIPENTAFFGQTVPGTGVSEGGVVTLHPGFNDVGSGGILDDPRFSNADFSVDGYEMMMVEVYIQEYNLEEDSMPEEELIGEEEVAVTTFVGTVTVENLAPESGTCQTPVWVGIHNGDFNIYDRGVAASSELEAIAEDGNVAPLTAAFAAADGTVWDDVVFGPDMPPVLCPGQTGEVQFMFEATSGVPLYFSYATMVLPSNDAFLANGNPKAFLVVNGDNEPVDVTFVDSGSDVLDAGTEINDEIPENTAFFGQTTPDTGVSEGGVVTLHSGFNAVGSGGILDDPRFSNADFTADGYNMIRVQVSIQEYTIEEEQEEEEVIEEEVTTTLSGTIKVYNLAPEFGTCQTPVWVGIHNGDFNIYDRGVAATSELEALAEDGNTAPISAAFEAAVGTVWDGVVVGPDSPPVLCPRQMGEIPFTVDVTPGVPLFFSYATMVIPSNDAFLANGNPQSFLIVTPDSEPKNLSFVDVGSDVLDAGTEVNDEFPANTAFFGQTVPGSGIVEGGVVRSHFGFRNAGWGGILDDERFRNADFTAEGYEMIRVEVTFDSA